MLVLHCKSPKQLDESWLKMNSKICDLTPCNVHYGNSLVSKDRGLNGLRYSRVCKRSDDKRKFPQPVYLSNFYGL